MELTVPDRFELLRPLGEGGMGVVYEAFDRERNAKVALKTLKATVSRKASAQALLRFKREFRALQDLHHRNLVTLGELIAHDEQWFFTMELVDGYRDFLAWPHVRPRAPMPDGDVALVVERERQSTAHGSIDDTPMKFMRRNSNPAPVHSGVIDEAKLRATLPQLAAGLDALHQAGKVHRDIKPSNVRVTPVGRVVLLDFGLVADVAERPCSTARSPERRHTWRPSRRRPRPWGQRPTATRSAWCSTRRSPGCCRSTDRRSRS